MQCLKSSAESGEQKFLNTMFPTIQQYTTGLLCIAVWSTRYGRSAISYERLHRFDLRFCLTFDYFLSEYLSALYLRMFTFRAATARRPFYTSIYPKSSHSLTYKTKYMPSWPSSASMWLYTRRLWVRSPRG